MLDFVQQLVSGIALGCVYGLIALGFVLVYKATEVVNFAQGDLMMLGGFFAFTFIGILELNYWIGFAAAVLGGLTSLSGAVAGGLLVGIVESMAGGYIHSSVMEVAPFIMIMIVLIVRPAGLFGRR